MNRFDRVIVVDWSARSTPSPKTPAADAIWIASVDAGGVKSEYHRTRADAAASIALQLQQGLDDGARVLAGFDFPFGYPAGFAEALTGAPSALSVWRWLAQNIIDDDTNANNRFDVAKQINARFPGTGPFWGCPVSVADALLPDKGSARRGHALPERRWVETAIPRTQPVWKLYTTGSVGSQALLGLPRLQALRERFGPKLSVWPFQPPTTPLVLAEVYPSMLAAAVDHLMSTHPEMIKDDAQVRVLAEALFNLPDSELETVLNAAPKEAREDEGWILGAGALEALQTYASRNTVRPVLRDDCFALPPGVDWVPVPEALRTLREKLTPVVGHETIPLAKAGGRTLAGGSVARRAHPPRSNSAVDGYGFDFASLGVAPHRLPLVDDVAAAGRDAGPVPEGSAVRILTGAAIPPGINTVILQEDVTDQDGWIEFGGGAKAGANIRRAGEDMLAGASMLATGHRLTPADLGLLAATGIAQVTTYSRLRVAVLSTGDELTDPASTGGDTTVFDANRPMLIDMLRRWGHDPVDCGIAPDDRDAVRAALNRAAVSADAILTSGGASAGDEDHVSALMRGEGTVSTWRIAVKPGRPLLLGFWRGVPVFGLPGNPVAAFVCTLIFARPALHVLAGGPWLEPHGFELPAAFSKKKKPGRHEYLRARLTPEGSVEVFASEGSGRISGISWADGLIELDATARTIEPGDPVRYLPYTGFGL